MARKVATFSERLNYIVSIKNITQQELADMSGVNKGNLSKYFNDIAKPKLDKIELFAHILGVSPTWLMGYSVPMYDEDPNDSISTIEYKEKIHSVYHIIDKLQDFTSQETNELNMYIDFIKSKRKGN